MQENDKGLSVLSLDPAALLTPQNRTENSTHFPAPTRTQNTRTSTSLSVSTDLYNVNFEDFLVFDDFICDGTAENTCEPIALSWESEPHLSDEHDIARTASDGRFIDNVQDFCDYHDDVDFHAFSQRSTDTGALPFGSINLHHGPCTLIGAESLEVVQQGNISDFTFRSELSAVLCGSSGFGKHGQNLGRSRNAIFRDWLRANSGSPYPNKEQLIVLAENSGLSLRQARTALSNLRARMHSKHDSHVILKNPSSELTYVARHMDGESANDTHSMLEFPGYATSVYDRPYPSPKSDIDIKEYSQCLDESGLGAHDVFSENDEQRTPFSDSAQSTDISAQSMPTPKRKGKRRYASRFDQDAGVIHPSTSNAGFTDSKPNVKSLFHCTVCPKSFKNAWIWKRHEFGTHGFHPTEWICMLNESFKVGINCIFCSQLVDDLDHFDQHNILPCLKRDHAHRTFALEDRMKQHVQQIHLPAAEDTLRKGFKVPGLWVQDVMPANVNTDAMWCGFCKCSFGTISMRMDHVAQHFRDGWSMAEWARRSLV